MDDHFDLDSLERFTGELADAGFQPVPDSYTQRWTGKIHPAFAPLTDATTMDIVIAPGWAHTVVGQITRALVSRWVIEWATASQTFRGLYLPATIAAQTSAASNGRPAQA